MFILKYWLEFVDKPSLSRIKDSFKCMHSICKIEYQSVFNLTTRGDRLPAIYQLNPRERTVLKSSVYCS